METLEYRYGIGESPKALQKLLDYRPPLGRQQNLMIRVMKKRRPFLIRDVALSGLNPANRILAEFHVSAFVICPLIVEEQSIGILGADRKEGKPRLTPRDMEFLSIFANNIATAIQRATMDTELKTRADQLKAQAEEIKSNYVSTMLALVKAIEEKDTYTKGHSERVADNARVVAVEMGLPEAEVDFLYFGSILHDVGKIGISESIVKSPKRLTEAERRIIQQHPVKGVEILKPISYIRNHMYLVRNHHERWDGQGYPDGLREDAIPLGAQIVAVADVWDAMTVLPLVPSGNAAGQGCPRDRGEHGHAVLAQGCRDIPQGPQGWQAPHRKPRQQEQRFRDRRASRRGGRERIRQKNLIR